MGRGRLSELPVGQQTFSMLPAGEMGQEREKAAEESGRQDVS